MLGDTTFSTASDALDSFAENNPESEGRTASLRESPDDGAFVVYVHENGSGLLIFVADFDSDKEQAELFASLF